MEKEFYVQLAAKKEVVPVNEVTDEHIKKINSLKRNPPPIPIQKEDIHVRSRIILGVEPTSRMSIHPEGELNGKKTNTLSQCAKLLPGAAMMEGHSYDVAPWGRAFYAEVVENVKGYTGPVIQMWYYFMKGEKGDQIAKDTDGGIRNEGSIAYQFAEARCSICHKPMAVYSFFGQSGTIPECEHEIGKKDKTSGQICYWYPNKIKAVTEVSDVFAGAYPKTKTMTNFFENMSKEHVDGVIAMNPDIITGARDLETLLDRHGYSTAISLQGKDENDDEKNSEKKDDPKKKKKEEPLPPDDSKNGERTTSDNNLKQKSKNNDQSKDNAGEGGSGDPGKNQDGEDKTKVQNKIMPDELKEIANDSEITREEREDFIREYIHENAEAENFMDEAMEISMNCGVEKRVCSECYNLCDGENGLSTCCSADYEVIKLAKVGTPVGRMKPAKSGAMNNEYFSKDDFKDLPDGKYQVEPEYDGVWVEMHRNGESVKLFTDDKNDCAEKFPGIVKEAQALEADNFVIAGAVVKYKGRKRLTHSDVTSWIQKDDIGDDAAFRFKPFDMLVENGDDITGKSLGERRELLEKSVPWGKQIHLTAVDIVEHKKDDGRIVKTINDKRSRDGAVIRDVTGVYGILGSKKNWEWKQQFKIDCRVTSIKEKDGGEMVYTCEVGAGEKAKVIGETFSTNIGASENDVISVSVDHATYDSEDDKYTWFAPKVIANRKLKNADPVSTLARIAVKQGDDDSRNVFTLTDIIPKMKRVKLSQPVWITGGIVENGYCMHDLDIVSRGEMTAEDKQALIEKLSGVVEADQLDWIVDSDGPADPNLLINGEMSQDEILASKNSNRFVLQEHGWGKSVHYDLRLGAPKNPRVWGWTCFSKPTTEAGGRKVRCVEKVDHDSKWMDVLDAKYKPGEEGNPSKKHDAWMKNLDGGKYELVNRKPGFLEVVLHGKDLKGRYLWREIVVYGKSSDLKIDGDEAPAKNNKIWVMWKPKDQEKNAVVNKLAYRVNSGVLFFWESDEVDTSLSEKE